MAARITEEFDRQLELLYEYGSVLIELGFEDIECPKPKDSRRRPWAWAGVSYLAGSCHMWLIHCGMFLTHHVIR